MNRAKNFNSLRDAMSVDPTRGHILSAPLLSWEPLQVAHQRTANSTSSMSAGNEEQQAAQRLVSALRCD